MTSYTLQFLTDVWNWKYKDKISEELIKKYHGNRIQSLYCRWLNEVRAGVTMSATCQ
uniref:Uncharacterized protein n=1 Tax=Rhizophagus irregularis (strain DAOM 181602 / DAOM 197198 / MUCL 43194) TaxID=747089 RepID=U9U5J9_RHIID